MPHRSQRDMRDFEEFDEFACERFRLLPLSSSVSEINSLTRRLLQMSQRRFEYAYTRSLVREGVAALSATARDPPDSLLLLDRRGYGGLR